MPSGAHLLIEGLRHDPERARIRAARGAIDFPNIVHIFPIRFTKHGLARKQYSGQLSDYVGKHLNLGKSASKAEKSLEFAAIMGTDASSYRFSAKWLSRYKPPGA